MNLINSDYYNTFHYKFAIVIYFIAKRYLKGDCMKRTKMRERVKEDDFYIGDWQYIHVVYHVLWLDTYTVKLIIDHQKDTSKTSCNIQYATYSMLSSVHSKLIKMFTIHEPHVVSFLHYFKVLRSIVCSLIQMA